VMIRAALVQTRGRCMLGPSKAEFLSDESNRGKERQGHCLYASDFIVE
jgi:hypothetical protein